MPEPKLSKAMLTTHRDILIAYLRVKAESFDWHAVSDVANDLRVLDRQLDGLR